MDRDMDEPSMNRYEQQLYSMFKSFDVNNEESLDESAVNNLCDALQLEERGAALVDTLFEQRDGRVSFAEFRNGLLAVLGEGGAPPDDEQAADVDLAPRVAFGSKTYGRRSRPSHAAAEERPGPRAASASRLEADDRRAALRPRYRRSASAMERRDDEPALEHDRRIDCEEALALCRSLRMRSIDSRLVERIFEDSPTPETTVGEFFDRLNSSLASAVGENGGPAGARAEDDAEAALAAERVAEAWESAGVRRPRRLLADLGFVGAAVRAADLERALDEELRAGEEPPEARAALLAAALAVSRLRAADLERRRALAAAERDKLRADVTEANARARLLAHEVDESHARIENELKASLKRAEARHADEMRRAAASLAAERELAEGERARLEGEVSRRAEAEARLRGEAQEASARAESLEARAAAAEERCSAAERAAAAAEARARSATEEGARAAEEALAAAEGRAECLAREVQALRDRADELGAALESSSRAAPPPPTSAGNDLSTELRSLVSDKEAGADDETRRLADLVRELESSLEAMRCEYESCEEYWSGKLAEERRAHEAEARASDDRLADLLARIEGFERRLAPPALETIAEQAALEAQVADLEAEFARYRRLARARLASLAARLERASRRRPAPAPAPPAPPPLAARCERAEAAVRRLHARLLAADALVKDLYVENCNLAHARPLPL